MSQSSSSTVLYAHPHFSDHHTPAGHPERHQRFQSIHAHISTSEVGNRVEWKEPEVAKLRWIETNHSTNYIRFVEEACLKGESSVIDSGDTHVSTDSFHVARLGVGGALGAVDDVMAGLHKNAFVASRPPGHHAGEERAMGFCLFNNVAIAARYAKEQYGLERVLILDWDVHHGNGTQDSFYKDSSVYFMSLHQYPFYPGTGHDTERGMGAGKGYTLNLPVDAGASMETYKLHFQETLMPAAEAFEPQLIFISAGFDAHRLDPLGSVQLVEDDFALMTDWVVQLATRCCEGKVVSLLEGGYHLEALAYSVEAHLERLCEA